MLDVKANNKSKITPLVILSTKDCFFCINNISEFNDLIKKQEEFDRLIAVFVDEESQEVKNFVEVTELDISFRVANSENLHPIFKSTEKRIIFIDKVTQKVIFYHNIPNSLTSLEHKQELIKDVTQNGIN